MTKFVRCTLYSLGFLACVFVIGAVAPEAQPSTSSSQGQKPASSAGGVAVDFMALGANGQPVADLQASDVTIRIAGRPRQITSLEFVKAESGGAPASVSALPPPYFGNAAGAGGTGRSVLILVDIESLRIGTERALRESLESLLNSLSPNDRVALSVAPKDTVRLGFSAGLPAVKAAAAKIAGIRPASVSSAENACRSRDSLDLLRNLIDSMAGADTPTSVLYIGSGLTLPGTVNRNATGDLTCEVLTEHFQNLAPSIANARVNLYVAQGDDTITQRDGGLDNLAGVANADQVIRAVGPGLNRIATESAGYYVATLAPDSGDRPGQSQTLDIKVGRSGTVVRARTHATIRGRGAAPVAGGGKSPSVKEMLSSTTPVTDLQLRVMPVVSRAPGGGGKLALLAMTEPVDPNTKLAAVSGAVFPIGQAKAATAGNATDQQLAGRPVLFTMAIDPGKYRVRIAATDSSGRAGAVDFEINAALAEAGPLKIGQIMLLAPRGQSFAPQLVYTDEPEVVAYLEMYADFAAVKFKGAAIDIAATEDGPALAQGQPGGQQTNEPDKFILNGKIPIANLKPGEYVIRVTVQAEGHPEGRVTRTFRKVAK